VVIYDTNSQMDIKRIAECIDWPEADLAAAVNSLREHDICCSTPICRRRSRASRIYGSSTFPRCRWTSSMLGGKRNLIAQKPIRADVPRPEAHQQNGAGTASPHSGQLCAMSTCRRLHGGPGARIAPGHMAPVVAWATHAQLSPLPHMDTSPHGGALWT